MPTRRKNVDLGRIKRASKKSRISDYFSSAYVQYLMIFLIWGALLLINQSTEMRFEYFWPGWLFICSIHDSLKYQGLQYTIVFIIIVITMDLICFFLIPTSWIYSCGSAYVWVYLLWHTDQGLCFLTLTFCFIFVYFELGFYSREAKFNHSIYLFRPFAAHSIGYPVVCMGFSIKRYLDMRHRNYKRLEVRRQNCVYFRILREAVPPSMLAECSGGYSSVYLPDDYLDNYDLRSDDSSDLSRENLPWSLFLVMEICKSVYAKVASWASMPSGFKEKDCNGASSVVYARQNGINNNSHVLINGALPGSSTSIPVHSTVTTAESLGRRGTTTDSHTGSSNHRRQGTGDSGALDHHGKSGVNSGSSKACASAKSRPAKEDLTTRLENSIRRLRTEVQSMRAVEAQLRGQLAQLERDDRLNRLSLSNQRQENETMASNLAKLTTQSRAERANLASVEQALSEERRTRQQLEEQLVEVVSQKETDATAGASDEIPNAVGHGKAVQVSSDLLGLSNTEPECVIEAPCCQRRHRLESEVYTLRVASRRQDEQLRTLSGARARQANHNQQQQHLNRSGDVINHSVKHSDAAKIKSPLIFPSRSVQASDSSPQSGTNDDSLRNSQQEQLLLETYLQLASEERERLANTLREENWMKQELLTAYHTSVREITELNKTHKQRDLQILELTMKIEQLECLVSSGGNRSAGAGKKDLSATSSSFVDRGQNAKLPNSSHVLDYPGNAPQLPIFSYFSGDDSCPCTTSSGSGTTPSCLGQPHLDRFVSSIPNSSGTTANSTSSTSTGPGTSASGVAPLNYTDRLQSAAPEPGDHGSSLTFNEMGCGELSTNSLSVSNITRLSAETH